MLEKISDTIEIELMDKGFPTKIENRRSIKLKEITHKKTTELWEKFLVWQKEQQTVNVPVEETAVQQIPTEPVEVPAIENTDIRAKLEEKVNILPRESYGNMNNLEFRAIKLKNKMIIKLNLRAGIIYSEDNATEEVKEITESEGISEQTIISEEQDYNNMVNEMPEQPEPIAETQTEIEIEIPTALRDDNLIIAPERDEIQTENSENIVNEEDKFDLDSIKITKNSQRIANMDVELPEYNEQEETTELTEEPAYVEENEKSIEDEFEEKFVIPNIQLDDIMMDNENIISPLPEFEMVEEPAYEEKEENTEEYVSGENKLNFEEQEEIISALSKIEENIYSEPEEQTEEEVSDNNENETEEVSYEVKENNDVDIDNLLQQLQQWKENKNKVQKELEETYAEIENSEQEKNNAKARLSKAIEALKEDCKEDERKAEENRDIIKSNEAAVNAILSAIDMNK